MKGLRGGAFDVFGYTAERKKERALIDEYFTTVDALLTGLDRDNHALAVEIASIPEHIRGYGHIKEEHLADARKRHDELMALWCAPAVTQAAA